MTPIELTKTEFIQRVGNFEESPKDWKYVGEKQEATNIVWGYWP